MRHGALRAAGSAVVVGTVIVTATPAYASTSTQVPVASTGFFGGFSDVTAVSATDGWAVGGNGNGVVQRFNGTGWSVTASPDLFDGGANTWAILSGVDSVSASSAFAVGRATGAGGTGQSAVALRWNGSAWSRLAVPRPAGTDTALAAVKEFSPSDVWAVGDTSASIAFKGTLAMHYNGTAWTTASTPSPGTKNNTLTSIDGTAAGDVWAVGYTLNLPYGNRVRQSVILHWNGAAWTQVASPNDGSTYLYDVAALSPADAWAVGNGSAGAFVLRWNGTAWNTAPAPPLRSLSSVTARSSQDVWVAGSDANDAPALAHWTGSGWSVTPVTVTGGVGLPLLSQVTVVNATTEWVVGSQWDGTTGQSSAIAFRIAG